MKKARTVFTLLSMATMVASISVPLMATGCRADKFKLDLSEVKKDQMFGYTTTYDIHPTRDINKIEFACTDANVLDASWEDNKLVITPKRPGPTTLIIVATDNDGNETMENIDIVVDSKVHEFINERTLGLRAIYYDSERKKSSGDIGTGWLFYHETDIDKAHNDYTYYLLTNNHVTSGFMPAVEAKQKYPEKYQEIAFSYQNWDEARGNTSEFFCNKTSEETGSSCVYNVLSTDWSNSTDDKFCTLFTSYITSSHVDNVKRYYYRDLTICKIDLSDYANTPVGKNRLDKLNEYANKHNNKLIEFDDYSDINIESDLRQIYAGGFPLMCLDETSGPIYPESKLKFQSQMFDDVIPIIYSDLNEMLVNYYQVSHDEKQQKDVNQWVIYDATGELHNKDRWSLTLSDWIKIIRDQYLPFGGGASGSLAISASDLLDPDTYRASGIYWGHYSGNLPNEDWISEIHFTPFTFNFGKNLPDGTDWNVIHKFYNSDAFKKWIQTDDCCYEFK